MRADALAALFFLMAAAAWAALPPNSFLDSEVRLEDDHRIYGQPLDVEGAATVVVEERPAPPVSSPVEYVLSFAAAGVEVKELRLPAEDAWAHWDRHKRLPATWNKGAFEPLP